MIDFKQMNGIYGLFASNRSGKSSLLDSLLYCIFDKSTKTDKAAYVLNNKKNSFNCKLEVEINNKKYVIERTGVKNKTGHVRVAVNFYTIDEYGNVHSLNGQERDETNAIIRSYMGTYKDFILTSVIAQNNNTGFIEMSQKERKELLSQFLDINIFDDLQKIASDEIKDVYALLKDLQKQDFGTKISEADKIIEENKKLQNDLTLEKKILEEQIVKNEEILLDIASKLIPLKVVSYDLDSLKNKLLKHQEEQSLLKTQIDQLIIKIKDLDDHIQTLSDKVNTYNRVDIQSALEKFKMYEDEKAKLSTSINVKQTELNHILDKMKKLEDLEYDKDCKFCMNNIFVKDAIQTKENFEHFQEEIKTLKNKEYEILELQKALVSYVDADKELTKLLQDIQKSKDIRHSIEVDFLIKQSKLYGVISLIQEAEISIKEYNDNREAIEFNLSFKNQIEEIKNDLKKCKDKLNLINSNISRNLTNSELAKQQKNFALDNINRLHSLEQEYKYYELYLSATNRNGVPYDLICKVLPQIETEINNVLGQLVDFTILLQTDEKNINAYIVYDDDNFWPLELTSGMERFISSLAIRSSLISITNLPKPNFIAIDEGFTQLDSDNMSSVYLLFNYLKTQFDFMMIISHIDVMRDMVDHFIDIKKEGEYSKVSIM